MKLSVVRWISTGNFSGQEQSLKDGLNITRWLGKGIARCTISLLAIWVASGITVAAQASDQAQIILEQLLDANKSLLDCGQGEITAVLTEHSLPRTTDENVVKARTEQRVQHFRELQQKNPQPDRVRFDLELAIPFNTRLELMNESTMKSRIAYRWQGDKYYYDMEVLDRQDSIEPSKELKELGTTHVFMTKWNGERIFTFDDGKAVNYFKPAKSVHIQKGRLRLQNPRAWGIPSVTGQLANFQELDGYSWSTQPVEVNNNPHQELVGEGPEGQWIRVIFDPGYETRPLQVEYQGEHSATIAQYGDYEQIAGQWFPKKVFLQSYRIEVNPDTGQTTRRLSKEVTWQIEQVDPAPAFDPESFKPELQPGDRVTDFRYDPPFQYIHADPEIEQAVIDELALIKTEYSQELASAGRPTEQVSAPPSQAHLASVSVSVAANRQVPSNLPVHSEQTKTVADADGDMRNNILAQSYIWPAVVLVVLAAGGILLGHYCRRKQRRPS